jgi:hypothetical protein
MRQQRLMIVLIVLGVAALYVGSYFYFVRPQAAIRDPATNEFRAIPDYGSVPSFLFTPVHWFDRSVLRPNLWSGIESEEAFQKVWGWKP